MIALVLFVVLIALIMLGVPVGFALGGATIIIMQFFTKLDLSMVASYSVTGVDSLTMMAIPFFILSGVVMSVGGLARRLVDVAASLVGWMMGGLGAVVSLASMFFGAISGSSLATVSCIGGIMVPEMQKKGYDLGYSAVFTACAGTIGAVIPPSIPLVVYGVCTSTSIGDLFLGGIFPGVMIGIALIISNYIICKKKGYVGAERKSGREILKAVWEAKWALFAPVIILGGIYSGIFTPTEASVVSVVYSTIVALFIYKEITWKDLYNAIVGAAVTNGTTTFLLGLSTAFAALLSFEQIPSMLTNAIINFTDNKFLFLMLVNIILLVIGCFIDNIPATTILAPMLLPAMNAFGVDPVTFGVFMTMNLLIGLVTPPYGCSLFVASAVCKVKMEDMLKNIAIPLATLIICLLLTTYIPWFTTWFL
jgi:tripartite ATP-independent transporter DctM subunit